MRPVAARLTVVGATVITAEYWGPRDWGAALLVGRVDAEPGVEGRPTGGELVRPRDPDLKGVPPVASRVANPRISASGGT